MSKFVGNILFAFVVLMIVALFLAIITQLAWAGSIAQIFHLPELTFFQAFCLNVLGGMLFKRSIKLNV